jgi:putative CocE/NonD family hydrolase
MREPTEVEQTVALLRELGLPVPTDLLVPLVPTPGATRRSFHLTMRDGVRVAVDLHLPPRPEGGRVPTCLRSTRYWRATVGLAAKEHLGDLEVARWTAAGFALVLVDARGTGASFGRWERAWDEDQRADLYEVVDWVVAQDWSDGTVGGYGTSYDGTTAHLLAATGHPAVTAVVPRFGLYDSYHHIASPGGVPLDWFTEAWATVNWALDGHPERGTMPLPAPVAGSVRPVDGDDDGALLQQAQAEHAGNWDLWQTASTSLTRDHGGPLPNSGQGTPYALVEQLRSARVPMWLWSSWYDGAYAAAQLAQLADDALDVRVTLGPFAHGAGYEPLGDPLRPELTNLGLDEQVRDLAGFLGHRAGLRTDDPSPARLRYYRLGDGWRESDQWPPAGTVPQRLHLASTGDLGAADAGRCGYDVDFACSTGDSGTRWHCLLGGQPVVYPDRRAQDERLLVWDGPVLAAPTSVTGTPVAHLELTSSADDFAAHVYLEAVRPDGSVLYLTEGQLRASHRRPGTGRPPYETFGPWHSHLSADLEPVPPGEVVTLDLALWPISVLVPAGWRLRVALAGADAPLFRRIPAEGEVHLEVLGTSWVEVPVGD